MKKVPTALYALFALQAFCALFFLADAIADFLRREREGVATDKMFLGERTPFKKGE